MLDKLNKEELISLLKSDVAKFNQYRKDTEYKKIDLCNADFSNVDLSRANLCGADLRYADLSYANLSIAILRCADLDYSSGLPLSCGSFNIKVDIEQVKQLLYHICRLDCDDDQFTEIKDKIKEYANQSSVIERHSLNLIE